MDPETLSETLEALSEDKLAKTRGKEVKSLKGVRGVPDGEIARVAAAAWEEDRPRLPDDEDALAELFRTAFEDGLVAVGLLAALLPDAPAEVLEIGLDWLQRTDDMMTADALGWLVLGPGLLASGRPVGHLTGPTRDHAHPAARRAAVMAGMALTGAVAEGPAAAPLRARVGVKAIRFVEDAQSDALAHIANAFVRDEAPPVRKALRRLVRTWAGADPDAVVAWGDAVRGGLPRMLRQEVERARRRAARSAS